MRDERWIKCTANQHLLKFLRMHCCKLLLYLREFFQVYFVIFIQVVMSIRIFFLLFKHNFMWMCVWFFFVLTIIYVMFIYYIYVNYSKAKVFTLLLIFVCICECSFRNFSLKQKQENDKRKFIFNKNSFL